ncbi:MAG: methyltransferase family protein, partial [Candidatus Zixiibacteriota bacterium]
TFSGRGTPAVFDPPRKLVVRGLYKYVRNPMYIGIITAVLGQVFVYGSPLVLFFLFFLVILFTAFVWHEEEPTLRKKFGEEYDRYCLEVNRWLPKF